MIAQLLSNEGKTEQLMILLLYTDMPCDIVWLYKEKAMITLHWMFSAALFSVTVFIYLTLRYIAGNKNKNGQ